MTRFLICGSTLVLLYPIGIDMYLVGLPRIAADSQASEAQLHIAFSVYLAGVATVMLFIGKITDQPDRKPVVIVDTLIFIFTSVPCPFAKSGTPFLIGRFIQGVGMNYCYVVVSTILRDTLDNCRRAKALPLLGGIICIVLALAPVMGHLIMLKYPWRGLFYTMMGMGVAACLPSVLVLRGSRPATLMATTEKNHTTKSLVDRFFLSRLVITTLSMSVILTSVNTLLALLTKVMGFDHGEYTITVAIAAGVSMAVSFFTLFALSVLKLRVLMPTSQVLFLYIDVALTLVISHAITLLGLTLICAGLSVGFGVAMNRVLGLFSLYTGITSSALGIAQVCGSSLWIWLATVPGLDALNMLIGILIGCSIVGIMLIITVAPNRSAPTHEGIPQQS